MPRALLLTVCVLAASVQPAETPPLLRLGRGQELVYTGSVQEEEPGRAAIYLRRWQLEVRALGLESSAEGGTIAVQTVLRSTRAGAAGPERADAQPGSVRLEVFGIDARRRLRGEGAPAVWHALEGPSSLELGFFVESPADSADGRKPWLVAEPGRPPRRYQLAGSEPVNGVMCLKIEGEQQSADWDIPRADSAAWRRRETLWITPRSGYAQQVARTLERRDPAHQEPTYRLITRYQLENWAPIGEPFLETRRREILQAKLYTDKVLALLPQAAHEGPRPFETLIARINHFADKHPETPYREALWHARRLAEAGRRNEVPPHLAPLRNAQSAAVGKPAPDFVAPDLKTQQNLTLRQCRGRTLLMAFYQPRSPSAPELLRRLQVLQDAPVAKDLLVVAFVMSDDPEAVGALAKQLNLTIIQAAGTNLRASYGVETTPRFVLVDADGHVASISTGWGPETPAALSAEIKRCSNTPPRGGTGGAP